MPWPQRRYLQCPPVLFRRPARGRVVHENGKCPINSTRSTIKCISHDGVVMPSLVLAKLKQSKYSRPALGRLDSTLTRVEAGLRVDLVTAFVAIGEHEQAHRISRAHLHSQ